MDSLSERSALTNDNDISFLNWESGWAVDWDISVSFFISIIFWNIMEIISSDNNGSLHLCWNYDSLKNLASNWDVTGEWALFINVFWFNSFFWCFEAKSDILEVSNSWWSLFSEEFLAVQEDVFLFLEGSFVLRLINILLGYQPLVTWIIIILIIY